MKLTMVPRCFATRALMMAKCSFKALSKGCGPIFSEALEKPRMSKKSTAASSSVPLSISSGLRLLMTRS